MHTGQRNISRNRHITQPLPGSSVIPAFHGADRILLIIFLIVKKNLTQIEQTLVCSADWAMGRCNRHLNFLSPGHSTVRGEPYKRALPYLISRKCPPGITHGFRHRRGQCRCSGLPLVIAVHGGSKPAQKQISIAPGAQAGIPIVHICIIDNLRTTPGLAFICADVQIILSKGANMSQSVAGRCCIQCAIFAPGNGRPCLVFEKAFGGSSDDSKLHNISPFSLFYLTIIIISII